MDLRINIKDFEIKNDINTSSLLLVKKGFGGLPDDVLEGNGFTIELKDKMVVIIDIYEPATVFEELLEKVS